MKNQFGARDEIMKINNGAYLKKTNERVSRPVEFGKQHKSHKGLFVGLAVAGLILFASISGVIAHRYANQFKSVKTTPDIQVVLTSETETETSTQSEEQPPIIEVETPGTEKEDDGHIVVVSETTKEEKTEESSEESKEEESKEEESKEEDHLVVDDKKEENTHDQNQGDESNQDNDENHVKINSPSDLNGTQEDETTGNSGATETDKVQTGYNTKEETPENPVPPAPPTTPETPETSEEKTYQQDPYTYGVPSGGDTGIVEDEDLSM